MGSAENRAPPFFLFVYVIIVNNGRKYNKGVVVNNILWKNHKPVVNNIPLTLRDTRTEHGCKKFENMLYTTGGMCIM